MALVPVVVAVNLKVSGVFAELPLATVTGVEDVSVAVILTFGVTVSTFALYVPILLEIPDLETILYLIQYVPFVAL